MKLKIFPYKKHPSKALEKSLKKVFSSIFTAEDPRDINLIFVDKKEIIRLNKIYLSKNKTTDVIAFNHKYPSGIGKTLPLGDVFVCVDTAIVQAKKFNLNIDSELLILCIHGFLHINGMKDYTLKERIKMGKKTLSVLKSL